MWVRVGVLVKGRCVDRGYFDVGVAVFIGVGGCMCICMGGQAVFLHNCKHLGIYVGISVFLSL